MIPARSLQPQIVIFPAWRSNSAKIPAAITRYTTHLRGQGTHPLLHRVARGERGVDHLERHDPGQFRRAQARTGHRPRSQPRLMTDQRSAELPVTESSSAQSRARPRVGAAQDGDLVAQHEELDGLGPDERYGRRTSPTARQKIT